MEGLEAKCFEIIASVGTARSSYIAAIAKARDYEFDEARKLIEEGNKVFLDGHKAHADLISKEANGEIDKVTLLLLHAEDQLMAAESFKIIAEEMILNYQKIQQLELKTKWQ